VLPEEAGLEDLDGMIGAVEEVEERLAESGKPRLRSGCGPLKKRLMLCFRGEGGWRTMLPSERRGEVGGDQNSLTVVLLGVATGGGSILIGVVGI
jgi:hypothetical protein